MRVTCQSFKQYTIGLLIVVSTVLTSCHDMFNSSLSGKKLYNLYVNQITYRGITIPHAVYETELNFLNNEEVKINLTVVYGLSKSSVSVTKPGQTYNYTFKDGKLIIPGSGSSETKLTESDNFYTDEDGEVYYKTSMLELTQSQKAERLGKLLNHPDNLKSKFLNNEIVMNHQ